MHTKFGQKNLKGREYSERHRRRWEDNIRKGLMGIGWGVVHWIHRVPNRDQWRVLVNTVMKLRFHKRRVIS
jgi:hypothetical protein